MGNSSEAMGNSSERFRLDWSRYPALQSYCAGFSPKRGSDGDLVICQGSPSPALLIVLEGTLQVERQLPSRLLPLALIRSGEIAGEMTLLENKPATANVRVVGGARWLALPLTQLRLDLVQDSVLASELYQALANKLRLQLLDQNSFLFQWIESQDTPDPLRKVLLVFDVLQLADLQQMVELGQLRCYAPGDVLIRAGQTLRHFFVVLAGQMTIWEGVPDQSRKLGFSVRGELLGELAKLDPQGLASATVQAQTSLLLAELPVEAWTNRLSQDSELASRWWQAMAVLGSYRCRQQLEACGEAAPDAGEPVDDHELGDISLDQLDGIDRAAHRFTWFAELMQKAEFPV